MMKKQGNHRNYKQKKRIMEFRKASLDKENKVYKVLKGNNPPNLLVKFLDNPIQETKYKKLSHHL